MSPTLALAAPSAVHYLPLATTALAAAFAVALFLRWRERGGLHLAWWCAGVVCYGTGTAIESAIVLAGNGPGLTRAWYAAGAVLGAYPLAQGSAYLVLTRRAAHAATALTAPLVAVLALATLAAPVDAAALEPHRPASAAIGWSWIRALVPFVNGYAALVLVGSAAWSAVRFARRRRTGEPAAGRRALGNALIALGALLPGIGGAIARHGPVEPLYVTELVGLALIAAGYAACTRGRGG